MSRALSWNHYRSSKLYIQFNSWVDTGYSDQSQEGTLIVGFDSKRELVFASWIDRWHNSYGIMDCQGYVTDKNEIFFKGSYLVDTGPDWEWKTNIQVDEADKFTLKMYNIHPHLGEYLAVQVDYYRS
ncbi:MAG: DUF1579 family protein [Candidatus Heimdallarchaeota archaeon]|nr:DUF1579 family protein [Candidatus Heimdallarchaeota archaeon]